MIKLTERELSVVLWNHWPHLLKNKYFTKLISPMRILHITWY